MDKQYFLDKLARTKPKNFESYSYELLPNRFKATDKIPIDCIKHGVFYQLAGAHLFSAGCIKCGHERSGNAGKLTTEEFIAKSKEKFGRKFDYSKTVYTKKGIDLTVSCPSHGDITTTPEWHLWSKHGCRKCDFEIPRLVKKEKIIQRANIQHDNKYDYSKVDFINGNDPVEIVCPIHGSFWQDMYNHSRAPVGCPKCSRDKDRGKLEDFIERAKKIHGERYSYEKVNENYQSGYSKVKITCKKHGVFTQRANSHLYGNGCKSCFLEKNRGTTEQFIKDAKLIHGDCFDYSKVEYKGNKTPVEIICKKHGSFWLKPNAHTSSKTGCHFCYESKGEVEICRVLEKYGIKYIREYRLFPHLYRCDFYLPDVNIFIEFNGHQHYFPVEMFGGNDAFLKVKENDLIKRELIKQRNSSLVVISHLSRKNSSVENDLIRELKRIYRFWFMVEGRLQVFKKSTEVYRIFSIPGTVSLKDLPIEMNQRFKDFSIVFLSWSKKYCLFGVVHRP